MIEVYKLQIECLITTNANNTPPKANALYPGIAVLVKQLLKATEADGFSQPFVSIVRIS